MSKAWWRNQVETDVQAIIKEWREDGGVSWEQLAHDIADGIPSPPRTASAATPTRQTAWLVEWPEDDNVPARWWNPATGWMRDANKALWFARESDVADYIASGKWCAIVKPTEHVFVSPHSRPDRGGK